MYLPHWQTTLRLLVLLGAFGIAGTGDYLEARRQEQFHSEQSLLLRCELGNAR